MRVSQLLVDGVYTVLMRGSKEERKTDKETKLFSMRLQREEKKRNKDPLRTCISTAVSKNGKEKTNENRGERERERMYTCI